MSQPTTHRPSRSGGGWPLFALAILLVFAAWLAMSQRQGSVSARPVELPPGRVDSGYVTSDACRSCHPAEHASWHQSYHRTMTQPANPATVIPRFDDVQLEVDGCKATLTREGDEYWVEANDPVWEKELFAKWTKARATGEPDPFETYQGAPPKHKAKVVMTTGSHHFQAFWVRGPERELWLFPWRYHIPQQRWVHRKDVFLAPPEWRPGMWARTWNDQCSFCHSTGPVPGRDPETGRMQQTEVAEFGIACEACHGEGRDHIRQNQDPLQRYSKYLGQQSETNITHPKSLNHQRSAEVCGSCHSHFQHHDPHVTSKGPQFRPGDELSKFGSLLQPPERSEVMARFWADGANRSAGREFSGMSQSACYQQGSLSCLSCHSMHSSDPNDQLSAQGETNEACYQCHEAFRERLTQHTHHGAESTGSLCYNCHMPHTNYGLFKGIRSHRIDIPRVTELAPNSRPNACNLCHLDKATAWTAEHLQQWFGTESPLLPAEEHSVAASLLWALRGDAGQRVIAAWHFGWEPARAVAGVDWLGPTLATLLDDPYAAVRWVAYDSIRKSPAWENLPYEFDGPQATRTKSAQRAMQIWTERQPLRLDSPLPKEAANRTHLLLDAAGNLLQQRFEAILRQRDDRMMVGVE